MELDEQAKQAVREIGEAINNAIEKSATVADAIERVRAMGYEPNLTLKLEIGLQEIGAENRADDFIGDVELELTDGDIRTLRRMKINIDK